MKYNHRTYYLHTPYKAYKTNEISIKSSVEDFLSKTDEKASYAFIKFSNIWGTGFIFVEVNYWEISDFKIEYPDVELYIYDTLTTNLESIISKNIKAVNQEFKVKQIEKDFS